MKTAKPIKRRDFIRHTSIALTGAALALSGRFSLPGRQEQKSRVVLIRDQRVLDDAGKPIQEVVLEMLDAGLLALTGAAGVGEAWRTIIRPEDRVGIKSNVWGPLPTTPQVEQALKTRVLEAGVAEERIGIADRGLFRDELFQQATALINVRPLRSHHWSGVGSLIKNYITFVPDPFNYHEDSCAALGSIWHLPAVKGKTRLNVLLMFTPQFHGVGPHSFNPRYLWKYHGLLLGFDPVAVDTIGLKILESIRNEHFAEFRPLNPPATHIQVADQKYGLGVSDPGRIELRKLGYDVNSFV